MAIGLRVGSRRRRAAVVFLGLLALTLVPACGKSQPELKGKLPLFPVAGKITTGGQPLAGAVLLFHPVADFPTGAAPQRPRAVVDAEGNFQVSTYGSKDGAPAGKYKVTVSWKGAQEGRTNEEQDQLPEQAPEVLQDPGTTKLHVQIKQGPNTIPAWDLAEFTRQASNNP